MNINGASIHNTRRAHYSGGRIVWYFPQLKRLATEARTEYWSFLLKFHFG